MALTLPYEFDTTGVVKAILTGVLGLLVGVIVPGILYSLFVSHSTAAAVQLLLIGSVTALFGWIFFKGLTGSKGVITPDAVVLQPSELYGIRLAGPAVGTFPLKQFKALQVKRIFGPLLGPPQSLGWHERVSLLGKAGTPDILIARTARDAGIAMGHELAAALNLPYLQEVVPA